MFNTILLTFNMNAVESCYLEHAVSRISGYLELFRDPLRIYDLLPFKKSGYLEYSGCGWTKFAYITSHSVMWFFKASTQFLNIVLTVS